MRSKLYVIHNTTDKAARGEASLHLNAFACPSPIKERSETCHDKCHFNWVLCNSLVLCLFNYDQLLLNYVYLKETQKT